MADHLPGGVNTLYAWLQYTNVLAPTAGLFTTSFDQVTRVPAVYQACGILRHRAGMVPGAPAPVAPVVNPIVPATPRVVVVGPVAPAMPIVPPLALPAAPAVPAPAAGVPQPAAAPGAGGAQASQPDANQPGSAAGN